MLASRNRHGFCISAPVKAGWRFRLRKNRAGSGTGRAGLSWFIDAGCFSKVRRTGLWPGLLEQRLD